MSYTVDKTIVLVGLMGAGKSGVGSLLADSLGIPFLDSDQEIESASNMKISEIFARDGESFFREKETQILQRLLDGTPCVLSTGGGAFLSDQNKELINSKGVSVWLKADLEIIWNRVKHKNTRPLLRVADPYAKLRQLFDDRPPHYEQAQLQVQSDGATSLQQMAKRVLDTLVSSTNSGVTEKG